MMSPNDYQKAAHSFASYGENPMYPVLGLAEETGEFCGKWAKFIRKHDGAAPQWYDQKNRTVHEDYGKDAEDFRVAAAHELGDVLWMCAECCELLGLTLEQVMQDNIDKLLDRKNRGVIVGEGDNR